MSSDKNSIRIIHTDNAPAPGGHYSQAVAHNNTLYVSGLLPVNPFTGDLVKGSIEDQTKQVLENLSVILKDAGSNLSMLIKVTIYVSDIKLWSNVNSVYAGFLGKHRPARVVVPTKELHHGALLELEAIAAL